MEENVQALSDSVKSLQERITTLDQQLRSWQVMAHMHCPRCGGPSVQPKPINRPFSALPLTDGIMTVLAEGDGRMGIRKLREILEEKGMKSKLGRYGNSLRTAIARLVVSGRLLKEGDTVEILK